MIRKEIAFYLRSMDRYGLPLDNRQPLRQARLDHLDRDDGRLQGRLRGTRRPGRRFLDESPTRVPMTDWYWTRDAKQAGFQARSVVGGVFIKLMADPVTWGSGPAATSRGRELGPAATPASRPNSRPDGP